MTSSDHASMPGAPPLGAPFRAALIQMRTAKSVAANIAAASALIRQAAEEGASYIQTPEMTGTMEENREALFKVLHTEEDDPALAAFRALAAELKVHLHIGSLAVRASEHRAANRSYLLDPDGTIAARYDKIHMFDVDLPNGDVYRESAAYRPGELAIVADLPQIRLGLTICYDLRFPALFRALAEAGAGMIATPAAFTQSTGEAHWHILQRARAIETGCFVLAAAQGGTHENGRKTFGHSLIIDPWGTILAEGGSEPGIIAAEIDPAQVAAVRGRIPSLSNGRRFELVMPADQSRLHLVPGGAA
ncbi:carbon-nitrogen hydrolase family protein [Ancylobacter polymorphus]|uniref:Carbon-nitrogen hydrolase family protein n=1 Tax=Ancylobacter polymorphus TaxID=223390 RepID=A0A9E6ZVE1_9HYPH|nr:carbon-nitrogen hydrolase family protein [Ancylobacter polymorphus]UOK69255.1 carbon-nitrogen hydrolase family protein [Ancylobacter polymorphus]